MRHALTFFVLTMVLLSLYGCIQVKPKAEPSPALPRDLEVSFKEGLDFTPSRNVTLSLYARGVDFCRLSNDGSNWSQWELYVKERSWTLEEGDGIKQVFYQCRNSQGNLSIPVSAEITLDTSPPTIVLLSPTEGGTYNGTFQLAFMADDSSSGIIRCDATLGGAPLRVEAIRAGIIQNISVRAKEGSYVLVLRCRDIAGSSSASVGFNIVSQPTVALSIDGGAGYTDKQGVSLSVESATATECRFTNAKDSWGDWIPYQRSQPWNLTGKDGTKKVFVQCRDTKGVLSQIASDTIVLDSKPPPYISLQINNGASWTNLRNVTLGLYAFSASECRYSNDGIVWSGYEAYKKRKAWQLTEGDGTKIVHYGCRRSDGEDIGTATATIEYSEYPVAPPSGLSLVINGGSQFVGSELVGLSTKATGAYECRFQEADLGWSEWGNYSTNSVFMLSSGQGAKTIHYECRNDFGSTSVYNRTFLDSSPPGEAESIVATASPYSVELSWKSAMDEGSGVKLYQISRRPSNGSKVWIGLTSGLSFKDERVVPGQTYHYSIQATDQMNNYGKESDPISVIVPEG